MAYLLLCFKNVNDLDPDGGKEEEVVEEVVVSSRGGHPHYVVHVGLLRVVVGLDDEVKLFCPRGKWVCLQDGCWLSLL